MHDKKERQTRHLEIQLRKIIHNRNHVIITPENENWEKERNLKKVATEGGIFCHLKEVFCQLKLSLIQLFCFSMPLESIKDLKSQKKRKRKIQRLKIYRKKILLTC
eukprot:TRINITY_DN4477_c0_g1_i2.p1 TRINITY_DN4477_c0_g1~~TRINITY_DN4477_c0_g1_i2.p1  ORF type:complete len:106 (+),score=21.99 TRINITY_DN4477_c0_g1_i2:249-566(+)